MSGFRRLRATVATFLALWVPVLIGLPMRADPAGSAMGVSMWAGHAEDGAMAGMAGMDGMAGMGAMSGASHGDGHAADVATDGGASHKHDRCCIICPCCGAVVPLPVQMPIPRAAQVAVAGRIDGHSPLAHRWRPDAERPPPRAPPTLLEI